LNTFHKIIRGENIIVKIKKKSEVSFWEFQILGIFSLFTKQGYDYFFITDKRILFLIKGEIITNIEYNDFNKIIFNSLNDTLKIVTNSDKEQIVSLKKLRLSFEEIQYLKNKLNA